MAKVTNSKIQVTDLKNMRDGDVAEVITWFSDGSSLDSGTVVQRYGNALIVIGKCRGESYPNIFTAEDSCLCQCKVIILPPGSTIIL